MDIKDLDFFKCEGIEYDKNKKLHRGLYRKGLPDYLRW